MWHCHKLPNLYLQIQFSLSKTKNIHLLRRPFFVTNIFYVTSITKIVYSQHETMMKQFPFVCVDYYPEYLTLDNLGLGKKKQYHIVSHQ